MSLTVLLTASLLAVSDPPGDKSEDADRVETGVIAETVALEAEPVLADSPASEEKSGDDVPPETKPQGEPAETQDDE
jgi:hypothetical protein